MSLQNAHMSKNFQFYKKWIIFVTNVTLFLINFSFKWTVALNFHFIFYASEDNFYNSMLVCSAKASNFLTKQLDLLYNNILRNDM